jgi:hypothetical protein
MSRVIGSRAVSDHFEPDDEVDPKVQRQLRGHLEQIDLTAYAANKKVLNAALGSADAEHFRRLASAAALARTRWVVAALSMTEGREAPTREQVAGLAHLRATYEELTGAYDGLRRMVERGYLSYGPAPQG